MKTALITGGASPIGAAISRKLAADGLHVIVHAFANPHAAEALAAEIRADGLSASTWFCDVSDIALTASSIKSLLEQCVPQVLVHNAGTHDDVPMAGMSESQWRQVLAVSLDGFFAVTQPLLLPMMATRWGRIVALSSVSAVMGNRGQVNYAAAKAGLIGAVRSLAREVASRGITVNAVAPGIIASPAVDAVLDRAKIAEIVPAKRAGKPEEVAALISFLASADAGYINGQVISINGGMA
jgi:3-oxoacyl-[acyl-carrier protein] reductase